VPAAIFRLRDPEGEIRLAAGDALEGPRSVLPADVTIDTMLGGDGPSLEDAAALDGPAVGGDVTVLPPIGSQEVWAAGVTYLRSREARVEEAIEASPYDRVYVAERPELFLKSTAWRVRGPSEPIAIRADSTWDVPEPELTLVLDSSVRVVGYTIGNDASSRSIEGENTLYLPQAKTYDGSCAIGPALVAAASVEPPFGIRMTIDRGGELVFDAATSTDQMARPFDELAAYLGRALTFPRGAFLMTGTGIVPDPPFTLEPGDIVSIAIDGLGTLTNPVDRIGSGA
jgi:2-dehydro-3-deoxy-D-arabinonate dehydratase